jgi:hypothetical protein
MSGWAARIAKLLAASTLAAVVGHAAAAPGEPKVVDGITVYLGVVPSEMIRGHPAQHEETTMHGGIPAGKGFHHVLVFLVDSRPQYDVKDMEVRARVQPLGLAPEQKKLEPMHIGGTVSFGNYFAMPGTNPFDIPIEMRRPGEKDWHRVDFEYRHPR